MNVKQLINVSLLVGSLQARADAGWPDNPHLPKACADAHAKALASDWGNFSKGIEQCLLTPTPSAVVQDNALKLLTEAYKANHGVLASDFRLPDGLTDLKLSQRRNSKAGQEFDYIVELKGSYAPGARVEKIRLIKYPEMVVANRDDKDNEFEEDGDGFNLKATFKVPLSDGLYQIQVKMHGGDRLDQWVPVVDWVSQKSPNIIAPQREEMLETPNPVFAWQAFSSEDLGYVARKFTAAVVRNDAPNYDWSQVWTIYRNYRDKTTYTIGAEPNSEGVDSLTAGRYLAIITYHDIRKYGALKIGKLSRTRQVFYVK